MAEEKSFLYKNCTLHYSVAGHGQKIILAFHGFGQDRRVFWPLAESLQDHYTFISFDLYFHGKSLWGYDEQPIEKFFWKELIIEFLRINNIQRFSLAGYSLGARFVMATLEALPEKIDEVFLLAPDGIKSSFWYSMATYPIIFRKIFKSMITHPTRFKLLANTLNEARLLNKGLLKFAEHQMNTEKKRRRVYYSWVVFRHLQFDIKSIADLINAKPIKLTIMVGRLDKVIKPKDMKPLTQLLEKPHVEIPETGHNGLLKFPTLFELFLPATIQNGNPG